MAEKRSASEASLFILIVAESRNFFDWFLPPPYEVQITADGANYSDQYVRRGELQATAVTMAVGTVASLMFSDPMPFIGMAIACAFLVFQYEHALKTRGPNP